MDIGSQEVSVLYCFQLNRFVIEPFITEFFDGWLVQEELFEDCKPVVHIPFNEELVGEVFVPKAVGPLPLKFSGNDGNAAECW